MTREFVPSESFYEQRVTRAVREGTEFGLEYAVGSPPLRDAVAPNVA